MALKLPPEGAMKSCPADYYSVKLKFNCSFRSSFCSWYLTYFRIISSSKPTVSTQYPGAQKWFPHYGFFLRLGNRQNILIVVWPFNIPIISDIDTLGGILDIRWIWSRWYLIPQFYTIDNHTLPKTYILQNTSKSAFDNIGI